MVWRHARRLRDTKAYLEMSASDQQLFNFHGSNNFFSILVNILLDLF
jgi:hypothetical protein